MPLSSGQNREGQIGLNTSLGNESSVAMPLVLYRIVALDCMREFHFVVYFH